MSYKIIIVDFDDSFTFNIANVLYPFEKKCIVVPYSDFFENIFYEIIRSTKKIAVILGPGPGNPIEYEKYYPLIKKMMDNKAIYVMGICLGHQMMANIDGKTISPSIDQKHGQAIQIEFKGESILVQRYNSLSVFEDGQEVNILHYENGVSYQFHPESIGSSQNDIFFYDLLSFIEEH